MRTPPSFEIDPTNFYEFSVECFFSSSRVFDASEVEGSDYPGESDSEPTGPALKQLDQELLIALVESGFAVRSLDTKSESIDAYPMDRPEDVLDGYSFDVHCSFTVDFVVAGRNVERISNTGAKKIYIQPTEASIKKLSRALLKALRLNYVVSDFEATAVPHDLRRCVTVIAPRHLTLSRPSARKPTGLPSVSDE